MDSDNQIDAKISQDAMATFKLEASNTQPKGHGPEKHEIELLDFKLVFMYSTPTPDLRLEVNSFRIEWEKGVQKFTPSKKLKKNKHVKLLLDRALQKVKSPQSAVQSDGAKTSLPQSSGSDIAHDRQPCQTQSNALDVMATQQLASQMHTNDSARLDRTANSGSAALPASTELLQRLAPSEKVPSRKNLLQPPHSRELTETSENAGVLRVVVNENSAIRGSSRANHRQQDSKNSLDREGSTNAAEIQVSQTERETASQSQNETPSQLHTCADDEALSSQRPLGGPGNAASRKHSLRDDVGPNGEVIQRSSKKRQRESVESQPRSPEDGSKSKSAEVSPSKKRRTGISPPKSTEHKGTELPNNAKTEGQKSNPDSDLGSGRQPMRADPWEGLESIPASEVTIPADQVKLLDDRLCWIPPAPGDPAPQGHVPPALLKQWNTIVMRRHKLAEEVETTQERSPSPTQDTVLSSSSEEEEGEGEEEEDQSDDDSRGSPVSCWEESPERPHPRNALPPSSSPVKQSSSSRREPTPNRNKGPPGDVEAESDTRAPNSHHQMPEVETAESRTAQPTPDGCVYEKSPSQQQQTTEASTSTRLLQNPVSVAGDRDGDVQMQDEPAVTEDQASASDEDFPAAGVPTHQENLDGQGANENDSGDESDESMMEASVPLGLGENLTETTQSTQAEQDLTSSDPSLPAGTAGAQVQVAVTPVTNNCRQRRSEPNKDQAETEPSQSAISSSQANKMSSQSKVLNTYPHHGSYEKSQSSHEGLNPSSLQSENGSLRVDVVGTQTQNSSSIELSQDGTQSQEIVLDSSGPAQRHQDISIPVSQSGSERPRLLFPNPIAPTQSQANEPTQEPAKDHPSQYGPASSPQVSPSRLPQTAVVDQGQKQGSRHSSPTNCEEETTSQARLNTQSTSAATGHVGHINNEGKSAEANEAYKAFCNHYPVYTGDFNHFTELCLKLQAVRAQGKLQQSFLWDDFIILHLLKYSSHIQERASQDSGILSYEDYFFLNFTHPLHKKRCLTAQGIDQAASQFAGEGEPPAATSRTPSSCAPSKPHATPRESANPPSTTSLANDSSNSHAHSVNEIPQSSFPGAAQPTAMSTSQQSSIMIKQEGDGDNQDFAIMAGVPDGSMDTDEVKEEKPTLSSMESTTNQITHIPQHASNTNYSEDISMDEIEETDLEDNRHETASVELGDSPFGSKNSLRLLGEEYDTRPEEEENWFASLRHMRPTGPVWSDDPNTPFKRFAEANMNVLSDRMRRGGHKVLVDEKGVIRRLIYR